MTSPSPRPQSLSRTVAKLTTASVAFAAVVGASVLPATAAHAASAVPKPVYVGGALLDKINVAPKAVSHKVSAPVSYDISSYHVAVGNQGSTQSCVAWAIGYALMGWQARRAGLADPGFAPYYVYSQINNGVDAGSSPADAINIVTSQGVDTTADYWQQTSTDLKVRLFTQPTAAERANAAQWRATAAVTPLFSGYAAGTAGIDQIKSTIAAGEPVAILMRDRAGLKALTSTSNLDSDVTGNYVDNHEVLALAYNATGLFVQNSWGTGWGSAGFGWLSWNVVQQDVIAAHYVAGLARSTAGDTTGPSVSAPASLPQLGSSLATSGVTKFVTSFSATDSSGVASTLVDVQVDGGTWTALTLAAATTTSFTYDLAPGHTYRFSASAYDTKGNWSGWVTAPAFTVGTYNENYASYSAGWSALTWASSVNGAFEATATANASASFTFTGRGVAWVANKDTNRGQAWVYIDGVYQGLWDLYGATAKPRSVVLTQTWATNGTHTVKIVNVATSGRPTIDLDAMVVSY